MKKLPLTLIPISLVVISVLLFTFIVPTGGDLISPAGDYVAGKVIGSMFGIFLVIDISRYIKKHKGISN